MTTPQPQPAHGNNHDDHHLHQSTSTPPRQRQRYPPLSPATIESTAGLTAGLIATLVVHPLDIVKTRLQVDTSRHRLLNSSRSVLRDLLRNEGSTRVVALYRGLTPNLVGNSAGWALYFLWYRQAQDLIRGYKGQGQGEHHRHGNDGGRAQRQQEPLTSLEYLAASAGSGILSSVLTNPIWVIKTRMLTTSATQSGSYPGMVAGLASIWRNEGWKGFFHGLTPTLFGVSHGALYFVAYEKLKIARRRQNVKKMGEETLSNVDTLVTSSLSKVFAGSLTYPHQVIRARMQNYDPAATVHVKGPGMIGVIGNIWRNEGILGFYKGLLPNLIRVVPSTCVTFLVYENVRWALPRMFDDNENVADVKGTI